MLLNEFSYILTFKLTDKCPLFFSSAVFRCSLPAPLWMHQTLLPRGPGPGVWPSQPHPGHPLFPLPLVQTPSHLSASGPQFWAPCLSIIGQRQGAMDAALSPWAVCPPRRAGFRGPTLPHITTSPSVHMHTINRSVSWDFPSDTYVGFCANIYRKTQQYHVTSSFFSRPQVMRSLHKLQESGFYWGAVGGREASTLLCPEPPGTFLIRDSSDHHHFFTLSVQTPRGTKNLRIHSEESGFFLQPDPQSTQVPPQFDCVLKLIAHYMGKGLETVRNKEGACGGNSGQPEMKGRSVYLIHTGGERIPLELLRPLSTSLSSLQHMCRRTLNNQGLGSERAQQLPHTLRDFLDEYDAPIWLTGTAQVSLHGPAA